MQFEYKRGREVQLNHIRQIELDSPTYANKLRTKIIFTLTYCQICHKNEILCEK